MPTPSPARKRAKAAYEASEALRAGILEAALDAIVTIDHEGRVLDFNPAAESIFGWSRAEALGCEMADLIIPHTLRERHRQGLLRAVETGENTIVGKRIEIVGLRRNGEIFPCELAITRVVVFGDPPRFTGHIRDITGRKQSEARLAVQYGVAQVLAESATLEAAAAPLLRHLGEGLGWECAVLWRAEALAQPLRRVAVWQAAGRTSFAVGERAEGQGLPQQARTLGEPVWSLRAPLHLSPSAAPPAPGVGGWSAGAFPICLSGEVRGVVEFYAPVLAQPGEELLGLFRSIGSQIGQFMERCRAEEELRQINSDLTDWVDRATREATTSQELFYKAFHSNPAAMTLSRVSDKKFVDVNAAFCKGTEFTREQTLGLTGDDLGVWMEGPNREAFYHALQTTGKAQDMEVTFRSQTGRTDHVLLSGEILELKGELHLLTVAIDINLRRQAEAELRHAFEQEKEYSRLKSSFVTLVSHEFRTPLGVIMSAADILSAYFDRLSPERRQEHLLHIHEASRRMADMMEEVLLLGRVEAGKMQCQPAPLPLQTWLQKLVDEMHSATHRRCELKLEVAPAAADPAQADEALLRHIFTNLLSNGAKYSEPGSEVFFTVTREGTAAIFTVRDTGIGIPEEDQAQLFAAFHRASNAVDIMGSGLGLTIVKRCVELHGGEITLTSRVGEGTTVLVSLPLFPEGVGPRS